MGGRWLLIWGTLLLKPSSWWEQEREGRDESSVWSQLAGHICCCSREEEENPHHSVKGRSRGWSVSPWATQNRSRAFPEAALHFPATVHVSMWSGINTRHWLSAKTAAIQKGFFICFGPIQPWNCFFLRFWMVLQSFYCDESGPDGWERLAIFSSIHT